MYISAVDVKDYMDIGESIYEQIAKFINDTVREAQAEAWDEGYNCAGGTEPENMMLNPYLVRDPGPDWSKNDKQNYERGFNAALERYSRRLIEDAKRYLDYTVPPRRIQEIAEEMKVR